MAQSGGLKQKISVIIVTHNSRGVVGKALASVVKDPLVEACFLVDNASRDGSVDLAKSQFPKINIIKNNENLGFGRANNLALERVTSEYALLLNPDAVMENGALEKLLSAALSYPDAAIIAPQIIGNNNAIERSYKRNVFKRENSKDCYHNSIGDLCAEFLSGAVWLVKMEHLRKTGFFDPKIFLFYEDDDLCLRLRQAGYSLVLTPEAVALHSPGKSSLPLPHIERLKQWHMVFSRLYLEKKYHGRRAAKALALRLCFTSLIKIIGYSLLLRFDKVRRHYIRFSAAGIFLVNE